MFKRIILFVLTNLAMLLALSITFHAVCMLLGVSPSQWLAEEGFNYQGLAIWALVFGMGGAVISLLMSKPMAKIATRAQVIDGTEGEQERWLVDTVARLAQRANIAMPEVAIYPGAANAFATGAFRNHALVACSTEILQEMKHNELEAILGHEISHVTNGDMVTLTLVQGVLNACVLFLSRIVATIVDNAMAGKDNERRHTTGGLYFLVYYALQILLGILASILVCAYSRCREYAADAGSARLLGTPMPMISALAKLGGLTPGKLPDSLKAFGIAGSRTSLFATHPSIEARIEALQKWHA